jgi:hypothetical protein
MRYASCLTATDLNVMASAEYRDNFFSDSEAEVEDTIPSNVGSFEKSS